MNEKKMELIGRAKIAGVLIDNFGQYVENRKRQYLEQLKADFRDGKHDLNSYISRLSALCALDDLQSDLTKDVRHGQSIQGGMDVNGEPRS